MKMIDKFLNRLKTECGVDLDSNDYKILRPNLINKQNWVWVIRPKGMGFQYGSQIPIRKLLKAKTIILSSYRHDIGNFYID